MAVRIIDIAKRAEVNASVVSTVVNGSRGNTVVSGKTREKVLRIAQEMGYVPNAAATRLVRGTSRMIGVLCSSLTDPHLYRGIAKAEELCAKSGYGLQISLASNQRNWVDLLRRGEVDLLVAIGFPRFKESSLEIPKDAMSKVAVIGPERTHEETLDYPRQWGCEAYWNDFDMGATAAKHLLALGHREIGVLNGFASRTVRMDGAIAEIKAAGAKAVFVRTEDESDAATAGFAMAEELLEKAPCATGAIMRSDAFYPGVLRALGRAGRRVPEDMSLIGCFGYIREVSNIWSPIEDGVESVLSCYFKHGRLPLKDIALQPYFNEGRTIERVRKMNRVVALRPYWDRLDA